MSEGKAGRLAGRRHQGKSPAAQVSNSVRWEQTNIPMRKDQGFKTGYADGDKLRSQRTRRYVVDSTKV